MIRRGGPPMGGDRGSVTAETAMALPALVLVLAAAMWALTVLTAQLKCVDMARAGARAAARGERLEEVRRLVAGGAPRGARISFVRDARLTRVSVTASVRPDWSIGVPPVAVRATATAATEPGAIDGQRPAGPEPPVTFDDQRPAGAKVAGDLR
ncbi:TadE family type IV pilus minor pilin [Sphaerisporangium rufum]|uniref:TadE family type IV pilus minor pilin n=1 Tax=Sphaerisporangium rufum TaxID=1381558 RepID=UPI00194F8A1D|nr:TadE family type IV pilus minor pilin [Sphaerisporangium rufum]